MERFEVFGFWVGHNEYRRGVKMDVTHELIEFPCCLFKRPGLEFNFPLSSFPVIYPFWILVDCLDGGLLPLRITSWNRGMDGRKTEIREWITRSKKLVVGGGVWKKVVDEGGMEGSKSIVVHSAKWMTRLFNPLTAGQLLPNTDGKKYLHIVFSEWETSNQYKFMINIFANLQLASALQPIRWPIIHQIKRQSKTGMKKRAAI